MSEQRWWFSVKTVASDDEYFDIPGSSMVVERFETFEQASLHAAAVGGFVPFQDFPHGVTDFSARRLYTEYLGLSEPTK